MASQLSGVGTLCTCNWDVSCRCVAAGPSSLCDIPWARSSCCSSLIFSSSFLTRIFAVSRFEGPDLTDAAAYIQASICCLLVQFPHGNSLSHLSLSVVSFLSFVLLFDRAWAYFRWRQGRHESGRRLRTALNFKTSARRELTSSCESLLLCALMVSFKYRVLSVLQGDHQSMY